MIKSHIEAIQREIKERLGVEVDINFYIHLQPGETRSLERAEEICCALQTSIDGEIGVSQSDNVKWLYINNYGEKIDLFVFYS